MKIKFSILDYIIIIAIIGLVLFSFYHITMDMEDNTIKTTYDDLTITKMMNNYLDFHTNNYIIKTTVNGINTTTGNNTEIKGIITWIGKNKEGAINVQIDTPQGKILAGLPENVPYADIYIKTITIETTEKEKYNATDFTIDSTNITNLNDLKINTTLDYEISTKITTNKSIDSINYEELLNNLIKIKKVSIIKSSGNEITLNRASSEELTMGNQIIGNINGTTNQIHIKIYDCTEEDKQLIKSNFNVININ